MSLSSVRQSGRTPHLSSQLTPKVMTALSLAATGLSWSDAAAEVGMRTEALRQGRHHPDSQPFLERVVTENLVCAKNTAISKARKMIDICVQIAEDPKTKPYSRIAAANTVLDKALKFDENDFMRKELAKVRELLEDQEAGRSTQIIDVSE